MSAHRQRRMFIDERTKVAWGCSQKYEELTGAATLDRAVRGR